MFENTTNHTSDQDILVQNRSIGQSSQKQNVNRESTLIDSSDLKLNSQVLFVKKGPNFSYQVDHDEPVELDER